MNPHDPDSRRVSAAAPINRRTARVPAAPPPPGPLALDRQKKIAARALLGVPLADRVQAAHPVRSAGPPNVPWGAARIALALLVAASGCGVVLGALQSSAALGVAGAAGLVGAAGWGAVGWRRGPAGGLAASLVAPPGFDAEALRRLDDLLETVTPELPAGPCAQLVDLKDRFARIAGLLDRATVDETFTTDDRMYVIEALRRYLPDTLLAWLAVPPAQRRAQPLDGGATAAALLADQLALLQSELQVREDKLARAAGAALLRQQRFLQSKAGRRSE